MTNVEPTRDGVNIWAPKYAEDDDGNKGLGWVLLQPDDPDYPMWDRYLLDGGDAFASRISDQIGDR